MDSMEDKYWRHGGGKYLRLTDNNWVTWQAQITIALRKEQALNVVLRNEQRPADAAATASDDAKKAVEESQRKWDATNNSALSVLATAVSSNIQHLVATYENAADLMEYLRKRFDEAANDSGRVDIAQSLYGLKRDSKETVTAMIERAMATYHSLDGKPEQPTQQMMKAFITKALGPGWAETAIRLRTTTDKSLDDVIKELKDADAMNLVKVKAIEVLW